MDRKNYRAVPTLSNGTQGATLDLRGLFEQFVLEAGYMVSRLAALADRPRSPTGTTPEDRADRQRAVAFASPERSELGINDEVAAPHPPGPTY